jgi:hypothetical protein
VIDEKLSRFVLDGAYSSAQSHLRPPLLLGAVHTDGELALMPDREGFMIKEDSWDTFAAAGEELWREAHYEQAVAPLARATELAREEIYATTRAQIFGDEREAA